LLLRMFHQFNVFGHDTVPARGRKRRASSSFNPQAGKVRQASVFLLRQLLEPSEVFIR
jgi:hypothetical protein